MLDKWIRDMEQKNLIRIKKNKMSPEALAMIEFLSMWYYTKGMDTDKYWWSVRAHTMSSIDGGYQYCLNNFKGKR